MSELHTLSDSIVALTAFNGATSVGTGSGVAINTQGYRRGAFVITAKGGATSTVNFALTECATVGGTYSAAISGTFLATAIPATTAAGTYVLNVDLAKRLQFLKLTVTGTATDGSMNAVFLGVNNENLGVAGLQENTPLSV